MSRKPPDLRRAIIVAAIAVLLLVGLVLAAGGSLPTPSSGSSSTANGTPRPTAGASVSGAVVTQVIHLSGHTWRFAYTVHDTGSTPIAGFQINAPRSNLFHIHGRTGWLAFGSGMCGERHPGLLIYWSTSSAAANVLSPGSSARFSFDVNTTGSAPALVSLAWGTASPWSGKVPAPAGSSMKAGGPCR